jgi:hypothetical protein
MPMLQLHPLVLELLTLLRVCQCDRPTDQRSRAEPVICSNVFSGAYSDVMPQLLR